MALTYQQAFDLIGTPGYTGIDGLRQLAQETSAVAVNAAPNATTLLYSGDVDGINAWKIAEPASAGSGGPAQLDISGVRRLRGMRKAANEAVFEMRRVGC
ncbi:MAG: hypothetical protein PHY62_00245 [Gallionella sp.]|nr:hypothetical protein [Gallionella sp.]